MHSTGFPHWPEWDELTVRARVFARVWLFWKRIFGHGER